MINSASKVVVKVKGSSRVESTLSTILHHPLYKYIIYILEKLFKRVFLIILKGKVLKYYYN